MRVVLQRVSEAHVDVDGSTVGAIRTGFVVLLAISRDDTSHEADYLLDKTVNLRVFPDEMGKMNRNIQEAGGALLIISQFTLYADCRKGRRPAFDRAAPPEQAQALYQYFLEAARRTLVPVESGVFQASMKVSLVNEGPVTIWLDSEDRAKKIG
jgi:D-tyrosyl-tRNA(Tyr) deacylase